MSQTTLAIQGMSCSHCLNAVRNAIDSVPGARVETVTVGRAVVSYDPQRTKFTDITDALSDAGYESHEMPA
jgi:copper chaperone